VVRRVPPADAFFDADVFRAEDLFPAAAVLPVVDDLRVVDVFRVVDFGFAALRPPVFFLRDWPDSDIAIATACLRLLTFLPDPLSSSPRLYSRITRPTFFFCPVLFMSLPRVVTSAAVTAYF
jgi:hypothetical protein